MREWYERVAYAHAHLYVNESVYIAASVCEYVCIYMGWLRLVGVATISRLLKIIGLFCKRAL